MITATRTRARLLAISLLALLGLSLAGGSADAQIQPNHYKVYITAEQPPLNLTVQLIDQFTDPTTNPNFILERLTRFANPVSKNGEFIPDTTAHLTWWEIRGKEPGRLVVVDNQFGEQVLKTGDARYLLAPALKDPRPGAQRTTHENTRVLADSVLTHLRRMLNCWHEHAPAVPDYGIPSLSELVHSFPESIGLMQRAIRTTIEKYEPRLRRVRVVPVESDDDVLTLHFQISGDLVTSDEKAAIRLETRVDSNGRIELRQ